MTKIFDRCGVKFRHFYIEPQRRSWLGFDENQKDLLRRHQQGALELGACAARRSLTAAGVSPGEVSHICCVSSTGFLLPGLTAHFVRELDLSRTVHRIDVVGMGCSAALNGLNNSTHWVASNPGSISLLLCCEINSSLYVFDERAGTAVVNSLFGDGCAAAVIRTDRGRREGAVLLGFSSLLLPEALHMMQYEWSENHGRFEFQLAKEVPRVLGEHLCAPVLTLLGRFGLTPADVRHWVVHGGGKSIVDATREAFSLDTYQLRHTISTLCNYGNLGSASILFSYEALLHEENTHDGELALMLAMGPGLSIECALLRMRDGRHG